LLVLLAAPQLSRAQQPAPTPTPTSTPEAAPTTIDTGEYEAGEDDLAEPKRRLIHWNEFDGPISTFRFGFGFLLDLAAYSQSGNSEQQVGIIEDDVGVRDSRLLFRGRFKTERPLTWTLGYMYDNADESWRFRQTGIQIGFPEAQGNLFIGRTKEGYSLIKVMTGYHPWTQERSPGLDAFVPILADGLKWMGYFPQRRVFFSLGLFDDELSEDEGFSTYDHQIVSRVGWLPIASEEDETLLHLAVMGRDGDPDEGRIRFRSKPEESLSPFFVDTGSFEADHARTLGAEAYYRKKSWLFGGEFNRQQADAVTGETPVFHAADAVVTWLITGETRGYNARAGIFDAVSPDRTVFEGGPGAWEAVFHISWIDLDDGTFAGGEMWRVTPMVNWHLSDNMRFELGYGYAVLDRFGVEGSTQFLQSRIQLTL
jgi:phosphate-selective porin OprO/OprP